MKSLTNTYFIFSFNSSLFAVNAIAVRESFRLPKITQVEEAPPQVVGMLNVRGSLIPVIDLAICFGHPPSRFHLSDGIIVLENSNGRCFGLIVNEVHDVISIPAEDIEAPPYFEREGHAQPRLVFGEARVGEDIIMLLDYNLVAECKECAVAEPFRDISDKVATPETPLPPHTIFPEQTQEELAIFHRRAVDLMKKAESEDVHDRHQVAVVCLSGEFFGIELTTIREFSPVLNLTPIPNCPKHIVGNMNLRGNILTVIDIRGLLEVSEKPFVLSAKVVVTETIKGMVGIIVDDIDDLAHIVFSDNAPLTSSAQPAVKKYTKGTALYGGKSMTILDISGLMGADVFAVQATSNS